MSTSYQNSLLKKLIDIVSGVALLLTVIIAIYAVREYHRLNIITTETALINFDYNLNEYLIKKPYLQCIYAVVPDNIPPKQKADLLVNLCLNNNNNTKTYKINWKDVPDLNDKIWQYEGFNTKEKYKLRDYYIYAESILTLINNAYWAYDFGFIEKASWESFLGYIDEIGAHPIFLCVIHAECKNGYLDKKIADKIKEALLEKKENKEIISVIYRDMLGPEWNKKPKARARRSAMSHLLFE